MALSFESPKPVELQNFFVKSFVTLSIKSFVGSSAAESVFIGSKVVFEINVKTQIKKISAIFF
ncbi:hypothetical protein [Prochlorococcus marinus]|uniref:hypothetical protein n=1 Tax=Prochlorococcus marinus TaxID=1219 RepID=UPI0022B57223|nr:hypothetical protein [Prochlorococcus marinus]